jgi:enoyl-CoA hydratase/carnithine racemase
LALLGALGGLGLVLACDLAVAAETATFGTPEVKVGLFPMMVTALLARHVGMKRAFELALLGERLTAAVALQWGLVNAVVEPVALMASAVGMAGRVASVGPSVLRLGREAVYTAWDMDYGAALRYLEGRLGVNVGLPDARSGVAAFLASGRRPSGAPVAPPEGR